MKSNSFYYFNIIIVFQHSNFLKTWLDNFLQKMNYNLKNVQEHIHWTWMNFIHTCNMYFFGKLVLKVPAIYYEPSLKVVSNESKCMCLFHTSSLTHDCDWLII
jgi:hypothetical protein